jgi:hypothetical protein
MVYGNFLCGCRFRKRYNFLFDDEFPAEKEVRSLFWIQMNLSEGVFVKNIYYCSAFFILTETSKDD